MNLNVRGKCQAMYVWIDGTGEKLRGKTRTFEEPPKERFWTNFYGPYRPFLPLNWTGPWTVWIISLDRTFLNFQNGIMMVPALVKLGMKIHTGEHLANMFSLANECSSLFSPRIQFWLLFEAGENLSWSIPMWSTYSRSLWSSWFWQKSSCNKSQILLQQDHDQRHRFHYKYTVLWNYTVCWV